MKRNGIRFASFSSAQAKLSDLFAYFRFFLHQIFRLRTPNGCEYLCIHGAETNFDNQT
jgi:hypothetical protein